MAAYIDKADLIGNKLTNGAMQQKFREMTGTEAYFEVMKIVLDMPAADVEPVRHGRWLDVLETDLYVPDHGITITKTAETCSECKARIGFIGAKQYLFDAVCPNCSARMDGRC